MLGSLVFPSIQKSSNEQCNSNVKSEGVHKSIHFDLPKKSFPLQISNALTSAVNISVRLEKNIDYGDIPSLTKKIISIEHNEERPTKLFVSTGGKLLFATDLFYGQKKIFIGGITTLKFLSGEFIPIRTDIPFLRIHNLTMQGLTFNSGLYVPPKRVIKFTGNQRNGISLGFELINDQKIF